MKAPDEPGNAAEEAIAAFYQGGLSKSQLIERLLAEVVHIPIDETPSVDESGSASEGASLCLPKRDGGQSLVLVTSFPMFAPLAEEFPQYTRVFADHRLETVLVHCHPDYGFIINPRTSFEFAISPPEAAALREPPENP